MQPPAAHEHPNQFALLKQRRFALFFWTQFSGAANDNLFKFAYLPQALNERELTGGNGMVEMGTFVAILLGNIVGGLLVAVPGVGPLYVALSCVLLAVAGRVVAQFIPSAPAMRPAQVGPEVLRERVRALHRL